MSATIQAITSEKLKHALAAVDDRIRDQIRGIWAKISPAPDCPHISVVMKQIHALCAEGYRERGNAAIETVLAILTPVRAKLKLRDYEVVFTVAQSLLTHDPYNAMPETTPDVYRRRQAQMRKYEQYVGDAEIALITSAAANSARETLRRLKVAIDEMRFQDALHQPNNWQRWVLPI